MKRTLLLLSLLLFPAVHSLAQISVTSPADGATLNPPVWVRANVSTCNGSASTAFGYSVDDSSSMWWGSATVIDNTDSTITAGTHVIHFKAWSNAGMCPVVDRNITVRGDGISVASPAAGATLASPVWIRASVASCNGSVSTTFGYSIDDRTDLIQGTTQNDIDTTDSSMPAGAHTIHFKAWSANGMCPVIDRSITVSNNDGITVTSPNDNTTVSSPVSVSATVSSCNGSASTDFGYSVDDSSSMYWGSATAINNSDPTIPAGAHVIHFKAWSNSGMCPVIDRHITVSGSTGGGGGGLSIPNTAIKTPDIEQDPTYPNPPNNGYGLNYAHPPEGYWGWEQDEGGGGSGCSDIEKGDVAQPCSSVSTSSLPGDGTRRFDLNYTGGGADQRWHIHADSNNLNYSTFVYETRINISNPNALYAIEFDTNLTISGLTWLFGVQCNYHDGTWDVTYKGSDGNAHWQHSGAGCDRNQLGTGWHKLQFKYHRDANNNIFYDSVSILNESSNTWTTLTFPVNNGNGPLSLGWPDDGILVNFQMDSDSSYSSSGSVTTYLDGFNVYRW